MMMNGLADLQLQDPDLWLPRWETLSVEIVNWLSEKLQKRLDYPLVHDIILIEDLGKHRVPAKFVPRQDWWSETATIFHLKISSKEHMTTKTLFTVMTLKPNNIPHTGRVLLPLAPKKHNRWAYEWAQCCLFLSIIKALSIMNSLLKVRQLIKIFNWWFWDVWGCGMKKTTWNVDWGKLAPQSW
jgi:hypothetical protein